MSPFGTSGVSPGVKHLGLRDPDRGDRKRCVRKLGYFLDGSGENRHRRGHSWLDGRLGRLGTGRLGVDWVDCGSIGSIGDRVDWGQVDWGRLGRLGTDEKFPDR